MSKQMGIGNLKMPQRVKLQKLQTAFEIADAWSVDRPENSSIGEKTEILRGIDGVGTRMEFPTNAGTDA